MYISILQGSYYFYFTGRDIEILRELNNISKIIQLIKCYIQEGSSGWSSFQLSAGYKGFSVFKNPQ